LQALELGKHGMDLRFLARTRRLVAMQYQATGNPNLFRRQRADPALTRGEALRQAMMGAPGARFTATRILCSGRRIR
jgi:hypothetical protein